MQTRSSKSVERISPAASQTARTSEVPFSMVRAIRETDELTEEEMAGKVRVSKQPR